MVARVCHTVSGGQNRFKLLFRHGDLIWKKLFHSNERFEEADGLRARARTLGAIAMPSCVQHRVKVFGLHDQSRMQRRQVCLQQVLQCYSVMVHGEVK